MNKDLVNRRNTREWIKCNDDSLAHTHRGNFISEHGGEFIKEGKSWIWSEMKEIIVPDYLGAISRGENIEDTRVRQERKNYIFINKDGVEFLTDNFAKFCRKNDLNKSAMYKVMSGERNHHKGFTCKKLPPEGE